MSWFGSVTIPFDSLKLPIVAALKKSDCAQMRPLWMENSFFSGPTSTVTRES